MATLDWIIASSFLLLILIVGLSYSKKASKNLSNFFLGGRNLPWYIAGISMVATTFAADTPLAVTSIVGNEGISGNWVWWSFLLGGMLTVFFFARQWRRANLLTEVEFIELRYSGKPAAFLRGFKAVYLGLFMNMLIIAWVNVALISLLQVFFDITYNQALLATAGAMVFVAIYASLSGLLGVAMTDVIQFIIAMTGCIILAIIVLNSEQVGGVVGLKEKLATAGKSSVLEFFPKIGGEGTGTFMVISITSFFAYVGVQWWASWYPGQEPGGGGYVAQRMMSAKNEKHSLFATLFFQVAHYAIRPWPWIVVGLCALVLYPDITDKKLGFVMAMNDFLPVGLKGLLLVAFFAAYMSTISTQLNWGASYLVNDLYKPYLSPTAMRLSNGDSGASGRDTAASDKHYVFVSRIVTLLLMVVGLIASTFVENIEDVWKFLMACGGGLGLVLILRWYWWRINAWTEIAATVTPFIGVAITSQFDGQGEVFNDFGVQLMFIVALTTISWIAVMLFTQPTASEKLKQFYDRVRPWGSWKPVAKQMGVQHDKGPLAGLVISWLGAVTAVYSILFTTGKLILHEWQAAGWFGAAAIAALVILIVAVKRSNVFTS